MPMPRRGALRLEVRDLRLVSAVADTGGLTRAGAVLHLTQSALSHQLADLEWRVGASLFTRIGRRMILTPVGERLLESARGILRDLLQAEEDVRAAAEERDAILRISTECYTCYHWLPPVVRSFAERYPRVEPRIVAEATGRPLAALLKGQLELAIVSAPVRDRRVLTTPLFHDELVAVVAPDHPWAGRPWIGPEDFTGEHLLMYNVSRSESDVFNHFFLPARVAPRRVSILGLTEAIVELVKANLGVAVLARWAVAPHLEAGSLRAVRLGESGLGRSWSAAMLRHRSPSPHLDAFIELIRVQLGGRTAKHRRNPVLNGRVEPVPGARARRVSRAS